MKESILEKKCTKIAHEKGWITLKLYSTGFPDKLILKSGKIKFIEFKSSTGKLSIIQKDIIAKLTTEGFECFLITSTDDFIKALSV